ncbi:hypothetical protein Tco_0883363 [Tanacetum coccineum]
MCHHLSGATWHDIVPPPSPEPPPNHRSTVVNEVNSGGQWWPTAVNCDANDGHGGAPPSTTAEPPVNHCRTAAGQRWLTASQRWLTVGSVCHVAATVQMMCVLAHITSSEIKETKAYKTYLGFATGATPPKKARKFKKPASPKLTTIPVSTKEPTGKSKRVKRLAKKSTKAPARGVVIRETLEMPLSKKKEKVDVT